MARLDGADMKTRLGQQNSALGESAIAGTQIWEQQSKFRVRLGPLDVQTVSGPAAERHGAPADEVDNPLHGRRGIRL